MAIDSVWRMQLIIRQLGGVVTRINIQNPKLFNDFFASNPTGVFNDSSTCPSAEYARCGQPFAHAILVRRLHSSIIDNTCLTVMNLSFNIQQLTMLVVYNLTSRQHLLHLFKAAANQSILTS